ncbi:MAG: D-alanine--D-alanine ligase [Lachnospiraceae bacterium]|nr:D-alanine--D-alanine ligase [Lachnospiraceae bacterium]
MNIVVLCGGLSTERNVSLVTGNNVAKALRENGHNVIMLDVFMGHGDCEQTLDASIFNQTEDFNMEIPVLNGIAPDLDAIRASRADQSKCFFGPNVIQICRLADVVFMALHGSNGEDGRIQATFDLFGIPYTGSDYISSAISMNKDTTKTYLAAAGVPIPGGIRVDKNQADLAEQLATIKYPCVVKPVCGGSSIGVSIVEKQEDLQAALDEAFSWEDTIVIEDYVGGREFSVGVIEGRALPIIEIAPVKGFYDYKNKYAAGSAVETCPAEIPADKTKEMQHYAELAAKAIGLDTYARIDFLMNPAGEINCLEVNTLPGMTPTSLLPQEAAVEGVNYNELCDKLIQISLEKRGC